MQTVPSPDTLAIPPDLLAEIQAEAEAKHRPAGDVLRDVLERGLSEQRWQAHAEQEYQRAREAGIFEEGDGQPMTDEYRQTVREKIAEGLQSLREGKGTDGKTCFAELYAEMDALEQQRR